MTLFDPDLAAARRAGPGSGAPLPEAPVVARPADVAGASDASDVPPSKAPKADAARGSGGAGPSYDTVRVRLRLTVAYSGARFRGFAFQPGQRTVAGELMRAIATVVGHPVELTCAGRTDAGVHALGQVVHVDVRPGVDTTRLMRSVNTMLGPAVVVRQAGVAPGGFDARRSARARRYRYLVLAAPTPDPLLAPLVWHVAQPLDLRAMVAGADALVGEHDFRAFCRRPPGAPAGTPVRRRVIDARFSAAEAVMPEPDEATCLLRFDIEAGSFGHQMVRSIVGVLVEVGRGRRRVSDVTWLLQSGDRAQVRVIAPPQGLCLTGVDYG